MRIFKEIRTFRNWTLHFRNRLRLAGDKGRRDVLKFRSGLRLHIRYHTSDLATSRSVFLDDSYFPPGITLPEDAVVLDIGGHIGTFAVLAATRAPRGRVFSFEPEPENFALLEENIRSNNLGHVRCFNQAVGGREEERAMFRAANPVRTGSHSLVNATGAGTFPVRCTTLSAVLRAQKLEKIDFLKLDCEGAEWEIFPATSDDDLRRIRQIVMEVHSGVPGGAQAMRDSFDRLKRLGFAELPHPKSNYAAFIQQPA